MALKTKKFVQFLSAEKVDDDKDAAEEKDMENLDESAHGGEDETSILEEKKDK